MARRATENTRKNVTRYTEKKNKNALKWVGVGVAENKYFKRVSQPFLRPWAL